MADRTGIEPTARKIEMRIHNATVGLWQDNANDPSFRTDVFIGLLKMLGRRGWAIGPDAEIVKRHNCLKKYHRRGRKAELEAAIRISGRVVEIEIWSDNYQGTNRNGNRYGFGNPSMMPYLTRKRVEAEHRAIAAWASKKFETTISRAPKRPPQIPALDFLALQYASSWHSDKTLGRPVCSMAYNCKSADGAPVEHGATVWFLGRDGRFRRGRAYYNINNMWWVIESKHSITNIASHEIYMSQPADLRTRRRNARRRRQRLEDELSKATRDMRFERAAALRDVLFGLQKPVLIWSKKNGAYYRPCASGYTTDLVSAGRYTIDEAEQHVTAHSKILEVHHLDGVSHDAMPEVRHG